MSWSRPADLRAQVQRWWDRGELLAELVHAEEATFPRRLRLKVPTSADITRDFDAVRTWATEIRATAHCRIIMRGFSHRVFGANELPAQAWLDSVDAALALIGKRKDAARFRELLVLIGERRPELLSWLATRPLLALELAGRMPALLDVVDWLHEHPRPGVYLRQVDIPAVHSKFIEAHRGVLSELFDLVLDPAVVDASHVGIGGFAARYGFLQRPTRIRFRILDPARALLPTGGLQDMTLDAASFAGLSPPVKSVFITENETNFLAFPFCADSMVVFGAGYGWEMLAEATWLRGCRVHYWGDIDTHGFAILDALRSHFPHVQSLLMDRETLLAHHSLWGREQVQASHDLPRLTKDEKALYDDLRDNRIASQVRLEQERIGFRWLQTRLGELQRV